MAAITSIVPGVGATTATQTTLSADDTITFNSAKKQLLVLDNTTGGSLTCTIDGDGGSTVTVAGLGTVDVSAGLAIVVAAGASVCVLLSSVSLYCQGVVHLKGASTLKARVFDL